ncbi:MAG: TrkA family potassium uptake protein, partial [Pseudanabaenales cyanobacterium]|nr:TrkA family potassium uptake protein [Pseudanabaenales cyanobacterium]
GGLARLLGITSTQATGAVIVGCNPLSLLIARLFQERGESVVLIDTNPEANSLAEQENIKVFINSALDTEVLEKAGLSSAGTFLAMTNNGEVNAVVAQRALEEFQPPRVFAVFPSGKSPEELPTKSKIQQALAPELPLKTWNTYLNDGAVKLGETRLRQEGSLFQQAHLRALIRSGELVPLLLQRNNQLEVIPANSEWQVGDLIIYLLHDPKPKLLKRLSGGSNPRLTIEKLPAVEEVPMPAPTFEPPPPPSSSPSEPALENGVATPDSASVPEPTLDSASMPEPTSDSQVNTANLPTSR